VAACEDNVLSQAGTAHAVVLTPPHTHTHTCARAHLKALLPLARHDVQGGAVACAQGSMRGVAAGVSASTTEHGACRPSDGVRTADARHAFAASLGTRHGRRPDSAQPEHRPK
jgi:hypothetical protein